MQKLLSGRTEYSTNFSRNKGGPIFVASSTTTRKRSCYFLTSRQWNFNTSPKDIENLIALIGSSKIFLQKQSRGSLPQWFLGWQFVRWKQKVEPAPGQDQQKICQLVSPLQNLGHARQNYFLQKAKGSDHQAPWRSLEILLEPNQQSCLSVELVAPSCLQGFGGSSVTNRMLDWKPKWRSMHTHTKRMSKTDDVRKVQLLKNKPNKITMTGSYGNFCKLITKYQKSMYQNPVDNSCTFNPPKSKQRLPK